MWRSRNRLTTLAATSESTCARLPESGSACHCAMAGLAERFALDQRTDRVACRARRKQVFPLEHVKEFIQIEQHAGKRRQPMAGGEFRGRAPFFVGGVALEDQSEHYL